MSFTITELPTAKSASSTYRTKRQLHPATGQRDDRLCALTFICEDEGSLTVRLLRASPPRLQNPHHSQAARIPLFPRNYDTPLRCACNIRRGDLLKPTRTNYTAMERSGRPSTLVAVKRGLYDTLVAQNSRRTGPPETMKTSARASKSPSKVDSIKAQSAVPASPDQNGRGSTMPLSYLNFRDTGRYSAHAGKGNGVNFLQKNRQACSRTGYSNPAGGFSPLRSKIGQAPMIGDALGTPSNKGSSSFMSAGHNGVRDPEFKAGFKKREHNF